MFDTELSVAPSTQSALAEWLRTYLPGVLGIAIWALLGLAVIITVTNPLGHVLARRAEPSVEPSITAESSNTVATRNGSATRQ